MIFDTPESQFYLLTNNKRRKGRIQNTKNYELKALLYFKLFILQRSLRVLDGAITILDCVAGVQAQTETVWTQARHYGVPLIAYINKMDREGANFESAVKSIQNRLGIVPLPLQLPVGEESRFIGVVDLIKLELQIWSDSLGRKVLCYDIEPILQGESLSNLPQQLPYDFVDKVKEARVYLLEQLADHHERVADIYLNDRIDEITPSLLQGAVRDVTLSHWVKSDDQVNRVQKILPILCGSSLKNKCVQPLMDAIVNILPSPADRPCLFAHTVKDNKLVEVHPDPNENMCALAYKVVHLVYVVLHSWN